MQAANNSDPAPASVQTLRIESVSKAGKREYTLEADELSITIRNRYQVATDLAVDAEPAQRSDNHLIPITQS